MLFIEQSSSSESDEALSFVFKIEVNKIKQTDPIDTKRHTDTSFYKLKSNRIIQLVLPTFL